MSKAQHTTPQLRFPEFSGSWEKKKLGDIAKFSKGKGISKSDISENGILECIRYGELYTHYGERINHIISKTDADKSGLVLSHENDVIIPASGESQIDIAKASCVQIKGVALGGDLNIIRTPNDGLFLSYYLNSSKKNDIAKLAQGISVVHLYSSQLSLLNLNLPSLPEQTKVASFLTAVDDKLQALKKKKEALERYKKGMMQKLFAQEIRFKDDNGNEFPEWEKKKVKDIFIVTRGNVLSMSLVSNEQDEINLYPVYSSQTKNNGLSGYYDKFLFEDCITWTTDGAGAGDVNFRKGKFYCTNVCGVLKSDKGYANSFVAELLNSVSRKYVSYVGNPKLMNNVMSEIPILTPSSIEEQTKIANFLSALDDKINQVEKQVQGMEQWKKGLLQKLFV
jgi:type I restriction enzyme, S subunit